MTRSLTVILLRANSPRRPTTSVISAPAAADLWRCASRFAGGFISAGGGCGDAANGPDAFWNQEVPGADIGAQPRTARDVIWRVCRHLHCNVPLPGRLALDHAANISTRRGLSCPHFHYSA